MGETSVRSGRDGEKIAKEILKLIGWASPSCNFDIDCVFPSRHKRKASGTHGIDMLYSYDNPLSHNNRDVVICSSKHNQDQYSDVSNIEKYIGELGVSLSCAKESDEVKNIIGKSTFKTNYKGVLFWLSSDNDKNQRDVDIIKDIDNKLNIGNEPFDEIYIVDNKRASFLVSAIKNAEYFAKGSGVRFLYQNTGKNMMQEQLLLSGAKLPVQMINSQVLPLVIEEKEKISCLIFCENKYNRENLSRLIWLSHKLCGLTNEIRIYFPDYDNNKEFEVNGIKQSFRDENLTSKISVHRWSSFDIISLKETQNYSNSYIPQQTSKKMISSLNIDDDIDKILPFGDMLIPKLKTSILSDSNLKSFLFRKGIFTSKNSKDDILPIFSCLLLSPAELDDLKNTYKEKEDKPKEIERKAKCDLNNKSLWEIYNEHCRAIKNIDSIVAPKNCEYNSQYIIERIENNPNKLRMSYSITKTNTNKDFLTGKSIYNGEFEISYIDGEIIFLDRHTSFETYGINKKYFEKFDKILKKENISKEDFKSISFLAFDNSSRIKFMLNFFSLKEESKEVKIKTITLESLRFRPDEAANNLPLDLESLKGRVANLNLHGKELHDTIYLSNEGYMKVELCEKIKYHISYANNNRDGSCYLEISFSGALKKISDYSDSELRISITPCFDTKDNFFTGTKRKLLEIVNHIKNKSYIKYSRQ